ncbi:MAG: ribosomal protein S18-alanine N-acetyltransferase [Parvularculaceae bacterium]
MTRWRIRPAQLDDVEVLCALEAASFGPASWGANAVAEGLSAPYVGALIASHNDENRECGFVFWRRLGDEAEILSIGVAPEWRRRGCGDALLRGVINEGRKSGCLRLFLEVDARNFSAHALYRNCGFEQISRRLNYYKDGGDALVMRLKL